MGLQALLTCDCCGQDIPNPTKDTWRIGLQFFSFWNTGGDKREIFLCSHCGYRAAILLGFQYDTGKILSLSRVDMIDGVEVHGPNGGGISDIALNGIGGAHGLRWHSQNPAAPIAARMRIDLAEQAIKER